ncbi:MAG: hypothetical protein A2Z01_04595 [Betaproteobacteria bacterium RBG_16_58_11]|nr:MAG: hypothetical protein A2Z01_04595 [Betaproteobacteria bacterium RBG_16_58_11]
MKSTTRLSIVGVTLLLFGAGAARAAVEDRLDPQAVYNASQAVIGQPIGNYVLHDRAGNSVRLSDYRGKPLLVSFVYTGCFQICPTDTVLIAKAVSATQDLLGMDAFRTVSIGFNVPFDSPEAMASFARQQGISARNWEFLSPETSTVSSLTRDFGFTFLATPKGFDHVTQLTVIDREGRVYRQLYNENINAQSLVSVLRDLNNGALAVPSGWSGFVTRIRLLCTVYDRDTGNYRADYSLIVGFLVGLSILGTVAFMFIREWRAQRRRV